MQSEQRFDSAHLNTHVQVPLDENPTTGYHWRVDTVSSGLEIVKNSYAKTDPQDRPGSDGTRTFTLQTTEPGNQHAQFEYVRPWEDQPVAKVTENVSVVSSPNQSQSSTKT